MIQFLYIYDYDDTKESDQQITDKDSAASNPLVLNTLVYIIAEQYNIPALKRHAARKYERVVEEFWSHPSFSISLRLMYELTPQCDRMLKDFAIIAGDKHLQALCEQEEFATLCKARGEILFEITKKAFPQQWKNTQSECPYCKKVIIVEEFPLGNYRYHCHSCYHHF